MKIAIIKKTNEQVQILTVKGGWSTVKTQDGQERKVRNGDLTESTELTGDVAKLAAQKTAKAPKVAKEPRARRAPMPLSERKNGAVDSVYLQFYKKTVRVSAGTGDVVRSMDNGDSVAQKMRDLTFDQIYKWSAEVLGQSERSLRDRFAHLNAGMQRMNLGNMVRRALKGA
jgi:hypothetical protein